MDEAIRKADVLLEALGWIQRFRGRHVVIKLGGSALDNPTAVRSFLTDVVFMEAVGMRPVLVHGGGKAISRAMTESGIEPRFVGGRRFTDDATLEIVSRVLGRDICSQLVDEICHQGGRATGLSLHSTNVLLAETLQATDPDGEPVDLGRVGHVVGVNLEPIQEALDSRAIPVIPSLALDANGQAMNVNADTAAAALARFLSAEKLVFLSDVPGICANRSDPSTLLSHIEEATCRQLIDDGTIDAGMVPKVDAALEAIKAGVGKVHIVDARIPHSVLLEVYSDRGIGTEIVGQRDSASSD